ncbi:metal-dependent hydrolase, partial [Candidatus Roizmanbacteria bacterium]|nr:metal-dependent hydrolase [Candidatus Roizmanbacteria bacterium]
TMIGYFSHLVTDSMTTQGVPWLFPIPIRFGIPPIKALRIKTGGFMEKFVVLPGLILFNGYLVYLNYPTYELFVKSFIA